MLLDDEEDLPDRVTIVHRPATSTRDQFGNPVADWATADRDEDVPANFQPAARSEDVVDTDRAVTRAQLYLAGGATITAFDRVEFDGHTYAVEGEPERWRDGGTEDHVEVALVRADA